MATKTFKIGLSNTDKQNMAQDVYERLLALTFPEYDTTTTYEVGDFVVYNDQLYKCIGTTSGAWDSTKWQLATLNDLVTDIESAVAFVNDKANVDGNYPTMTVGVADNLSPYDEESGDDQDEPFSFQATGTANGTQEDFATGAIALMKEKQGNTVAVNQKISQPHQTNPIYGGGIGGFNYVGGHKLLIIQSYSRQATPGDVDYQVWFNGTYTKDYDINQRNQFVFWERTDSQHIDVMFQPYENYTTLDWFDFRIIDLTQWFNGDIPADLLSHPENFFRYYQGSLAYNEGELVNANGRYVKCIGRNQWDEEWELGAISNTTGENTTSSSNIRSKNYIPVIPNATYYFKAQGTGTVAVAYFYDINDNFIGYGVDLGNNLTFNIPINITKMRFVMLSGYGTTYNHDITISIYYEGESGYDQYYPYEVLTNNDTGTETLRSAGSVADIKLPSGEIKRNVGYVDLSTLTWTYMNIYNYWQATISDGADEGAVLSSNYSSSNNWTDVTQTSGLIFYKLDSKHLYINNGSSTDAPTGTLYYELATPTTEQGTPFSENLVIDDFGSMDFQGTNGVPQGNLIFYPVDYKAFIDTLYDYTEGTPSNLALKSDLASDKSELQGVDTQLLNAIGGTLRQCLCVKESLDFDDTAFLDLGTLSWTYSSNEQLFLVTTPDGFVNWSGHDAEPYPGLCTKYKMVGRDNTVDKSISVKDVIRIKDTTAGTDATVFKNSLKGVLLAYEKGDNL